MNICEWFLKIMLLCLCIAICMVSGWPFGIAKQFDMFIHGDTNSYAVSIPYLPLILWSWGLGCFPHSCLYVHCCPWPSRVKESCCCDFMSVASVITRRNSWKTPWFRQFLKIDMKIKYLFSWSSKFHYIWIILSSLWSFFNVSRLL